MKKYYEIFRELREDAEPNIEDLKALCLYYGVSADYILDLPYNLKCPEK